MVVNKFSKVIAIISIFCLIFTLTGCFHEKDESIFVTSYNNLDTFDFEVENLRTCVTGAEYEFKTDVDKESLFGRFATENELFERKNNSVSVIYENEIFTLKHRLENNYVLHGEYIMWKHSEDFYYIPFPTGCVSQNESNIPRITGESFEIQNIDYEYFEKFYSVYTEVNLVGTQIEGPDYILKLPPEGTQGTVLCVDKHNTGDGSVS